MRSRDSRIAPRSFGGIFDFDVKEARLAAVDRELEDPKVWDNPQRAQQLGKEKKQLDGVVHTLAGLQKGLNESSELYDLARAEDDDDTLLAVEADVSKLERTVADMSCQGCVASVTRVLQAVPGVSDATVVLKPGTATVTYDPAQTSASALRSAIENAGYGVGS